MPSLMLLYVSSSPFWERHSQLPIEKMHRAFNAKSLNFMQVDELIYQGQNLGLVEKTRTLLLSGCKGMEGEICDVIK